MDLGAILSGAVGHAEAAERAEREATREVAMSVYATAYGCAAWAAGRLAVPPMTAFQAMTCLPDELLRLLDTPQGWSALADLMADRLGCERPMALPAIN